MSLQQSLGQIHAGRFCSVVPPSLLLPSCPAPISADTTGRHATSSTTCEEYPPGCACAFKEASFFLQDACFSATAERASLNGMPPPELRMRYLFEDYALDTDRRELSRRGDLMR